VPTLICGLDGVLLRGSRGADGPTVDLQVVEVLTELRDRGWELVAADDAEAGGGPGDQPGVLSLFERVVHAGDIGAARPDPRFFAELLRWLAGHGLRLYVDADARNVSAARRAGLDAHLFTSAADLLSACRSAQLAAI